LQESKLFESVKQGIRGKVTKGRGKMKNLSKLLLLLMFGSPCFAQNAFFHDVALQNIQQATSAGTINFASPLGGAIITVGLGNNSCTVTQTATGSTASCSPLASICVSSTDTSCIQPNPTSADSNGNYGFYLVPNRYQIAITGTGVSGKVLTYDLPVGMYDTGAQNSGAVYLPNGVGGIFSVNANVLSNLASSQFGGNGAIGTINGGGIDVYEGIFGVTARNLFRADPVDGNVKAANFRICAVAGNGIFNSTCPLTINSSGVFASTSNLSAAGITGTGLSLTGFTNGCLQVASGVVSSTGSNCGGSGGTVSGTGTSPDLTVWTGSSTVGVSSGFTQCSSPFWAQGITVTGTANCAQPAFSNLLGNIGVSQMNSGTGASSSTFWRGDGTWVAVGVQAVNATSGAVNFGTATGPTTLISNVGSSADVVDITFIADQVTVGVGCTSASNTITPSFTYTDAVTGSTTVTSQTGGITGNGRITIPTWFVENGFSSYVQQSPGFGSAFHVRLVASAGTSISFTVTSVLGSISCSTTPQYQVWIKAVY
jgi:hypothetical protein